MYWVAGSPPLGAAHTSVTVLPDDDATRFNGAAGAVAGDAIDWRSAVAALKQDRVEDAERQAAKLGAAVTVAIGRPKALAAPVG
jgi:hypothetical protein